MTGKNFFDVRVLARVIGAIALSVSALLAAPVQAASERALYLYYTHTQETARIVFKRNGQYVQSGLDELNVFLRDWRRNEPAKMDPRLFDLVWEVYQEVGGSQPVNVVSAYRSPATNAMLAANSSGVADNSQHMRGTAMDFFIPGVPLAKLRAAAMRKQVGGVGYYPTSGSPFVHLDTGNVRAWPRMTRAQLQDLFPDGRTMHLPNDGRPLSQEGYQVAMAEWKRCHSYPCNGSSSGTQVASGGSGRTLMDVFFGGNDEQPTAVAAAPAAAAPAPAIQTAALTPNAGRVDPAMPVARPADLFGGDMQTAAVEPEAVAVPFSSDGSAPLTPDELGAVQMASIAMPVAMPDDLRSARTQALPSGDAVTALAALTAVTMPTPRVLMTDGPSQTMSAYLPANPSARAQDPVAAIIGETTTASIAPLPAAQDAPAQPMLPPLEPAVRTASLAGTASDPTAGLFDQTFGTTNANGDLANALAEHVASRGTDAGRAPQLVAPDLDHVADIFTAPATMNSDHFAVIFDRDEADFDPNTQLGSRTLVKGIGNGGPGMVQSAFPISVAN